MEGDQGNLRRAIVFARARLVPKVGKANCLVVAPPTSPFAGRSLLPWQEQH
jgi:hypothetical protein